MMYNKDLFAQAGLDPEVTPKNWQEYMDICQALLDAGIVPIVEPEVVYAGDYPLVIGVRVLARVLEGLFKALKLADVDLSALILKTNMVTPGAEAAEQLPAKVVGKATVLVLRSEVPKKVAGVVFLSGGQSSAQATENLAAVVRAGARLPYRLTFSFARALQDPALQVWRGNNANSARARQAFLKQLGETVQAVR